MEVNYIAIYDDSPSAKYVYVSDSVQEVLGYAPNEMVGTEGYKLTHPDEREALRIIHTFNCTNQRVSCIVTNRILHKDGYYVTLDTVVNYCYNVIVCTCFVSNSARKRKMRTISADASYVIQPDGSIQTEVKIPSNISWTNFIQEPRFCLILNRYSELAYIVFATSQCEDMVCLNQIKSIGTSLYDYVAREDYELVKEQIEVTKREDIIAKVKFRWLIPKQEPQALEAVISSTYDGLVMVLRFVNTCLYPV
ncbi:hypothetical protein RMATCC62417_02660 [Rhizopus microsporus]|nr:hypothetical protein RMATCC62417_02660 [Rhizopus microsporus]